MRFSMSQTFSHKVMLKSVNRSEAEPEAMPEMAAQACLNPCDKFVSGLMGGPEWLQKISWSLDTGSSNSITAAVSGDSFSIYFDFENGRVSNDFFEADFNFIANYSLVSSGSNPRTYRSIALTILHGSSIQQSQNFPARLASGAAIGASQQFGSAGLLATNSGLGNWNGGTHQGYVGLRFKIDPNSTKTYYGWADITVEYPASGAFGVTLNRFAYNDVDGETILAGQTVVPEPDTALPMALLVLGSTGMARYRRRNRASVK
jgi:hypothetical protein